MRPDDRLSQLLALVLLTAFFACAPNDRAHAGDAVTGSARDADTNEPIADAWIFETVRKPRLAADTSHVARARSTRSDANGLFRFEDEFELFSLGRRSPRRYHFYHSSYGLVHVRAEQEGRRVMLRPSLRDSHLRKLDASAFCNAPAQDAMAKKIVELVCPPADPSHFPDGSPRAMGNVDERGRREGSWTFFRKDGSVIARGEYRRGGAVDGWRFNLPESKPPTSQ